jgi:hypothetical protein
MKKTAIALSAVAGIMFLSGCAYDGYYDRYAYNYNYDYDYGYRPVHHFYFQDGIRYDCRFNYNVAFCG